MYIPYFACIIIAILGYYKLYKFIYLSKWVDTQGTVIKSDTLFEVPVLVVKFQTKIGIEISTEPQDYSYNSFNTPKKNSVIDILYNPKNPHEFILKSSLKKDNIILKLWLYSLLFLIGILGLYFLS